jgi:NhaC family Na+:H+ antiporter
MKYLKGFSPPFIISYVLTAAFFLIIGGKYVNAGVDNNAMIQEIIRWVSANFNMSVLVLLPFVVAVVLALRKVHAIVLIYGTGITALILGFTLQGFGFINCVNASYSGFSTATMLPGVRVPEILSGLLNRGGMYSMADGIVFFIIMLACIAIFDVMGVFDVLKDSMFKKGGSAGLVTLKASICSFIFAIVACEPYTTIMLSSEVIKKPIKEAGYETTKSANISMAMGQMTAYLCPWSFLAVYMGIICGVPVLEFIKYAVLFWLVPVVIIILSFIGIGNEKIAQKV